MTTLVETPTYESRIFEDGTYEIRQTNNLGATWNVAKIQLNGEETIVKGDQDEIHSILADCLDLPFEDVSDWLEENYTDECEILADQVQNDRNVWQAKQGM